MIALDEAILPDVIKVCTRVAYRSKPLTCLERDDMVAVALERLVRSSHRFRSEDMGLVAVIARRAIVDEMRRLRYIEKRYDQKTKATTWSAGAALMVSSLDRFWNEDDGKSPLESLPYEDDLSDVVAYLEPLTDRERYVVCSYADGYSQIEIGETLGISESRVSQILTRARERILIRDAHDARSSDVGRLR